MAETRSDARRSERRYSNARDKASNHKGGFDNAALKIPTGVPLIKVDQEGIRRFDIMPYVVGKAVINPYADPGILHYELTWFGHRDVGAGMDWVACPIKMLKQPCPICEFQAKLRKRADSDEELVKSLAPRERQLFNVIDLDDPDFVSIWEMSYHNFGKLLDKKVRNSDDPRVPTFFSLEDGLTLRIAFEEGKFGKGGYQEAADIEFRARNKPYGDKVLDEVLCLEDCINILTYEQIKDMFLQTVDDSGRNTAHDREERGGRDRGEGRNGERQSSRTEERDELRGGGRSRDAEPERQSSRSRDEGADTGRSGGRTRDPEPERGGRTREADKAPPPADDDWDDERGEPRSRAKDPEPERPASRSRERDPEPEARGGRGGSRAEEPEPERGGKAAGDDDWDDWGDTK